MRISGLAATAVGFACTTVTGVDVVSTLAEVSPSAASNVAKASAPIVAQKPVPGVTSKAPVTTHAPPVTCASGSSFAPVISKAAQIKPATAQAAAANRAARWGINEAISPTRAQANKAMAMGARVFSVMGRLATGGGGAGVPVLAFCCCSRNRRAFSAGLPPSEVAGLAAEVSAAVSAATGPTAASGAACPRPSTRSTPLMATGSVSPTRTVKKTRKKHAAASAKAIAALHAGKLLPLAPSDAGMLAGGGRWV